MGVFPVTFDSHAEHGENYVGGARTSFLRRLQVWGQLSDQVGLTALGHCSAPH